MPSLLQSVAVVLAMTYLSMLIGMYAFQRKLQYMPSGVEAAPTDVGLPNARAVKIETKDHEILLAWHHPARPGMPTILYFHGNGGGISTRPRKQAYFAGRGFGLLAVSYRGYEGSTGSPSENGLMLDAEAAYAWLESSGVGGDKIFILGESLGTGVAVQLAARREVRAIALEAPYASAVEVGASRYWFLPVRWLMKDQFRSADFIKDVKVPLFIIHGTEDRTVPFPQGQKLFSLANEPKQMAVIDGGDHGIIGDERSWSQIANFFSNIERQAVE